VAGDDTITLISDARKAAGDKHPDNFESSAWARLAHASDAHTFAGSWLDIQCRSLEGVIRAIVVLRPHGSAHFTPAAVWPEGVEGSPRLAAVVEKALQQRSVAVDGLTRTARRQDPIFLAHPILVDDELYGAAAFEVEGRSESALRELIQQLGWGIGWLEALARRKTFTSKARLVTVLELIATSLQHERFQAAATAVVTELATTFGCERVSIGFMKGRHIQLRALSHSAAFAKKTNLVRAIEGAMDEAADQLATVVFPARKDGPFQVTRAHAELLQQHGTGAVCTIPLTAGPKVLGALVLELPTGAEFDARTVELCEHAALLVGPMLDVKRREDRWLITKALDSSANHIGHLIGPRHIALKLWVLLIAAVVTFFAVVEGDYVITADANLEGSVQRAVTAAMQGYIVEARVRAGDVVRKGDVMAVLDDRDLRLERQKLISQTRPAGQRAAPGRGRRQPRQGPHPGGAGRPGACADGAGGRAGGPHPADRTVRRCGRQGRPEPVAGRRSRARQCLVRTRPAGQLPRDHEGRRARYRRNQGGPDRPAGADQHAQRGHPCRDPEDHAGLGGRPGPQLLPRRGQRHR
jgi:hypothetical protein